MFDHPTKSVLHFNGNQFSQIFHNDRPPTPHEGPNPRVVSQVKRDSHLNGYSDGATSIKVPRLTFDSISRLPEISVEEPRLGSGLLHSRHGSCSFDLAERLELLPGQSNNALRMHLVDVEINGLPTYNDTYCGYISRQALVFLASRYATRIGKAGQRTSIDTTLGRFSLFEHNHGTYVHFDSGTRTVARAKRPCEFDFDLEAVQRLARGQYFLQPADWISLSHKVESSVWKSAPPIIDVASSFIVQDVDCQVFIPEVAAKDWEMVERFSGDLMGAVSRCFLAIDKPDGVRQALLDIIRSSPDQDSIANTVGEGLKSGLVSREKSIEEKIVIMGFVITVMHGMGVVQGMAPAEMRTFIHLFMVTLSLGHSALRGAKAQEVKLAQTSAKRFKELFEVYKDRPGQDALEEELQKLLHTPNNLCLVLWQGALAYLAYNNACRVKRFMIGAPEEWIQFVLSRDSDVFIGSL